MYIDIKTRFKSILDRSPFKFDFL